MLHGVRRFIVFVCFVWAALPVFSQVPLRGSGLTSVVDPAYGNAVREYYVGADQHVHELFLSGGKWSDGDLFAIAPGPNVAARSALTSVFDPLYKGVRTDYIATDQHVHELFLSGGSWQSADLTSAAAGTVVSVSSSLVSIIDPNYNNAVREYYVGADQHVHELFLYGGYWQDADLIAATGGTGVAAGSALASLFDPHYNGIRTDYIGADQHVHELFLSGGTWQNADLTAITGGAGVSTASGLASVVDPVYSNAVRDYYVGADQHVHELFLYGGHWQDADLIAITGGSSAVDGSTLAGLFDPHYNGIRTAYISVDQHIHELFLSSGIWQNTDLTAITGGASVSAASDLASVVDPVYSNAVREYYVGTDQHVHELFLYGGHWQDSDLTTLTGAPSVASLPPDPSPAPYPDYMLSPPSAPPGACNITGNWADSTTLGSSWSLTQTGANVVGTYQAMITPLNPSCGSITWHVTGTYVSGVGTFVATSPSSAFDQCGNPASSTINATVVLASCTAGAAQETSVIPPWKNQFGQSGPGGTAKGSGAWALGTTSLTFALSSTSQIPIPGLSNAQMVPISITDNPQLTTTASVSGYSFTVAYPAQFLGNPHSACQASLSIPSANGSTAASSNMSAPNGCGGIFSVAGSIGQSTTQNAIYAVAPPDILVRELWGEANTQAATGDQVSELAIGNAIRQRFGDKQYFNGFNNYEDMTVETGYNGLSRCGTGCLSTVQHSAETANAALIYAGVNTPATDVADSKCFLSPTPADWQKISQALLLGTATFPAPLTVNPGCWSPANRQIVYKVSVGNNAIYKNSSVPAFLFEQWRDPSSPSVIQIP